MVVVAILKKTAVLLLTAAVALPPLARGDCCCTSKAKLQRSCCKTPQPETSSEGKRKACCHGDSEVELQPSAAPSTMLVRLCGCSLSVGDRNTSIARSRLKVENSLGFVGETAISDALQSHRHLLTEVGSDGLRADHTPLFALNCAWIV